MSNLVDYAKDELKRIGMIDSGEAYNDWATKSILDLIELFASQGHSGFTAPYVAGMFHRLAMFKPASPLTGEDDEWDDKGDGLFQNKRYFAVFKDKDGTAYNIEGKVFTDDGEVWYTCRDSKVNVTFPYVVPEPERVYRNKENKEFEALNQEPCEDWHDIPSGEMIFERARQAVRELGRYVMKIEPCKMREANKEEREGIDQYIDSIAESCEDCISREAARDLMYHKQEPLDEYDLDSLPSVTPKPEIVRCNQCKYAEVADSEDSQDGYTCQFHRGSIWFSGSYCSWAERRQDG